MICVEKLAVEVHAVLYDTKDKRRQHGHTEASWAPYGAHDASVGIGDEKVLFQEVEDVPGTDPWHSVVLFYRWKMGSRCYFDCGLLSSGELEVANKAVREWRLEILFPHLIIS